MGVAGAGVVLVEESEDGGGAEGSVCWARATDEREIRKRRTKKDLQMTARIWAAFYAMVRG
jgi:hypothetical protein